MKSLFSILALATTASALMFLSGCSSGVQTVSHVQSNAPAAKTDFSNVVKGNPNIPDAAKKAMMGTPNPGK
jgi:PBP1b-binding outer membrane lipoprotein LpoB